MSSINKVCIMGRLGQDPEVKSWPSGDQYANISIATSEKWKDKQSGEMKEKTEWHRCTLNGRQAEIAGQYLRKGHLVYVEGKIQTRKWTDKDGNEKSMTEINVRELVLMPNGERDTSGGRDANNQGTRSAPAASRPAAAPAQRKASDFDDDIPFITASAYYDETTSKARRMSRYDY